MKSLASLVVGLAAVAILLPTGAAVYYGNYCATCHEIRGNVDSWQQSTHRGVACSKCHNAIDLGNLRRLWKHVRGDTPEQLAVRHGDVRGILERCRECHRQEYADWAAGPHSATYKKIFLDEEHNRKKPPTDDCLRCHGMHFEGGIHELRAVRLADQPAMPCLACHAMHRKGALLAKAEKTELARPSLAFYDRRERRHVPVAELPLPAMLDGSRPVRMSPDARQGLCYQCHAPLASRTVLSGDDRTAVGVHEGISCLACHARHGQKTRASCAECHPRLSNCGLDVEKMDTTYSQPKSRHNIHFVKCADCHPGKKWAEVISRPRRPRS